MASRRQALEGCDTAHGMPCSTNPHRSLTRQRKTRLSTEMKKVSDQGEMAANPKIGSPKGLRPSGAAGARTPPRTPP